MHPRRRLPLILIALVTAILLSVPVAAQQYRISRADYGFGRQRVDVTARLRELARSNGTFRMGNSTFGVDPARGVVKTLRIWARRPGGQPRLFEYREGSIVDGAMFSGWDSGNWGREAWNGGWDGRPMPR
ncbi:MAG TPA: hypothetical protein VLT90_00570 [Terriglobales bacterium]|nr:hypothetical protein [Terriglobales bacterium]